ncbi:uncharacterized protein LOC120627857 isoform X2 [Pararge aegeria]|uniref:uncharacterized protein LOC120627857 isoform X2 n=1 Tax=Pararge aegeria TaxID=116150 RepID=UPI0019CFF798|nr:uncharacterized protein LOC120627857 isoform X2 [Pararge aegeria]
MCQYVAIVATVVLALAACIPSPLRLTIDCRSEEDLLHVPKSRSAELSRSFSSSRFDINSFCNLIHRAIPEAIKDGKFVTLPEADQVGHSDTVAAVAVAPPRGFIPPGLPKLRPSRLGTPRIDVPKLRPILHGLKAPRIGPTMSFRQSRYEDEESSAERMEKFKKGVQKMLHVVKVIGKIDQYLSERTRIVVDKLTKTFSD